MKNKIGNRLLTLVVFIFFLFNSYMVDAQEPFLEFPLVGYTPYNVPISSVFDHYLKGAPSATNNIELPYDKDGVVVAYTGEKGNRNSNNSCYQQQNSYIFRLHGNYRGNNNLGKSYLCYDGHPGIDYIVPQYTDVVAAADGNIIESRCDINDPNYGKYLKIDHGNGYFTLYGNLDSCIVSSGPIKKGQYIAETGNSIENVGYHLHFEVRYGNSINKRYAVDPYGWKGNNILWDFDMPSCTDELEPNDSFSTAYGPLATDIDYTGKICNISDQDFFMINVVEPGTISLSLKAPSSKDYQLELFNKSFIKVDRAKDSIKENKLIKYNAISTGIYYIRIYGEEGNYGATSAYTLSGTWPTKDTIPPTVNAFGVAPTSLILGNSFIISYTVSDINGSGLKQVELRRARAINGVTKWPDDPIKTTPHSGHGPFSGSFSDSPIFEGTYWYSIHVVDNAGNWNDEQNSNTNNSHRSYGPIETTVTSISDTMPTADFTGNPQEGKSPLTVNFNNNSIGYNLPLLYEWDFNNDGIIDSSSKNPSYTYARYGIYTVTLKIIDSNSNIGSLTKTEYIYISDSDESQHVPNNENSELQKNQVPDKNKVSNTILSNRWVKVAITKSKIPIYIDSKTMSYSSKNIVKLWTKTISNDEEFLDLLEIDCLKIKFRMLNSSHDKNPAYKKRSSQWRFILPESSPELVYDVVCKKKK